MPLKQEILQTALSQEQTAVFQTYAAQTTALLSDKGIHLERFTDIATCLMARDYKGLGKQTGNGVIEYENRTKSK